MTLNDFQRTALGTAIYPKDGEITYLSLALCGEAGEVAEKVKKVIRDNNQVFTPEHKKAIALEAGDVLWYLANLANALGYSLNEVAQMNIDKINSRQQRNLLHGSGDNR